MIRRFVIALLFFSTSLMAQYETEQDVARFVYRDQYSIGVMLHTGSIWPGVNFRRLYWADGFRKWGYEIDYTAYRHPREIKFPAQSFLGSSRSFTYGKINDFFAFRGGYGRERVLYDKRDQGSISISLETFGGVSLGFLKPIYVETRRTSDDGAYIEQTERYDPDIHDNVTIFGEAPYFTGFNETQLRPGVYGKVGVSFDYNFLDQRITSMEVGTIFDFYPDWSNLTSGEGVPVLARVDNPTLWWQIYVSFNFGNKW